MAQGAIAATQAIGASISALAAGEVTETSATRPPSSSSALRRLPFSSSSPSCRDQRGGGHRHRAPARVDCLRTPTRCTLRHHRRRHPCPDLSRRRRGRGSGTPPRSRRRRLPRRRGDDRARADEPEEAFHAIDLDTIALLVGMMIVVAHPRFRGASLPRRLRDRTRAAPLVLLFTITVLAGVLSLFRDDATV